MITALELADAATESLALVGDGDWTPQDTLLAQAVTEIRRLSKVESDEHEAWMVEVRKSLHERKHWLSEHESQPSIYMGYKQPGASPTFYGPDDIVVDGDWFDQFKKRSDRQKALLESIDRVLDGSGNPQRKVAAIWNIMGGWNR